MTSSRGGLLLATVSILPLVAAAGCVAGFRGGHVGPIGGWPPPALETKVSISLRIEGDRSGSTGYFIGAEAAEKREAIARAYRDSELFTEVVVGDANADLRGHITIVDTIKEPSGRASIDIFFGVIPIHQKSQSYTLTTTFTAEGDELLTLTQNESIEIWSQLFLTFLYPLKNPARVEKRVLYDITRQTILDALSAGVFHGRHRRAEGEQLRAPATR
jgi:hypothetical protein